KLFAQRVTAADVDRHPRLQIGQGEVHAPVAAERGAEQREQRLVLIDGQQLPVAQSPALGGKTKRKDSDFRQEWVRHGAPLRNDDMKFLGHSRRAEASVNSN